MFKICIINLDGEKNAILQFELGMTNLLNDLRSLLISEAEGLST